MILTPEPTGQICLKLGTLCTLDVGSPINYMFFFLTFKGSDTSQREREYPKFPLFSHILFNIS